MDFSGLAAGRASSVLGYAHCWGALFEISFLSSSGTWSSRTSPGDLTAVYATEVIQSNNVGAFWNLIPEGTQAASTRIPIPQDYNVIATNQTAAALTQVLNSMSVDGYRDSSQYYTYACLRCGMTPGQGAPSIPNSGYSIHYEIHKNSVNQSFYDISVDHEPDLGFYGGGPGDLNWGGVHIDAIR